MTDRSREQGGSTPPPHDLDAEESVLGAMMIDSKAIETCSEILDASSFYRSSNGVIFDAVMALHERGEAADVITVHAELLRRNELARIATKDSDGATRLREIAGFPPAVANVAHHARIVAELSVRRSVLERLNAATRVVEQQGDPGRAAELLDEARAAAAAASEPARKPGVLIDEFLSGSSGAVDAVWGAGDQVLWAVGEPLMIVGGDGAGKTSLAQQLLLRRAGILQGGLLGFPVIPDERPVLYLAADRPRQAERSLARMVSAPFTDPERLRVIRGVLDFDAGANPARLAALATSTGAGTVVLDSLKDFALDLASDETGAGVQRAFQMLISEGVEVVVLHHPRKGHGGSVTIHDVYGSRWLTAVCGSVLALVGEPGATNTKLLHLKQPSEPVGPLALTRDHRLGTTEVVERDAAHDSHEDSDLEGRLISFVAANPGSTQTQVLDGVPGKSTQAKVDLLKELVASGPLRVKDGARNAKHYSLADDSFLGIEKSSEGVTVGALLSPLPGTPFRGAGEEEERLKVLGEEVGNEATVLREVDLLVSEGVLVELRDDEWTP
jgi:replicative DNA helicase